MKHFKLFLGLFLLPWLLAFFCVWLSDLVMQGYQDCTGWFDAMLLENCAPEGTLLLRYILGVFALGLFFLPAAFAAVFTVRRYQTDKAGEDRESAKIFPNISR